MRAPRACGRGASCRWDRCAPAPRPPPPAAGPTWPAARKAAGEAVQQHPRLAVRAAELAGGGAQLGVEPFQERLLAHALLEVEQVHHTDHRFLPRASWTSLASGSKCRSTTRSLSGMMAL